MGLLTVYSAHGRVVGVLRTIVDDFECLRLQEFRELFAKQQKRTECQHSLQLISPETITGHNGNYIPKSKTSRLPLSECWLWLGLPAVMPWRRSEWRTKKRKRVEESGLWWRGLFWNEQEGTRGRSFRVREWWREEGGDQRKEPSVCWGAAFRWESDLRKRYQEKVASSIREAKK